MKCFQECHNTEIRKTFETLFDEIFLSKVCDQINKSQWNPTVFLEHYLNYLNNNPLSNMTPCDFVHTLHSNILTFFV